MIDLKKYREDFPILKRKISNNDLIFFDNGATTQKPNQVIDAISDYYRNYNSNIHRSVYTLGDESEKIYEGSKELVKEFINASSYEEVIYTSGTTESLNFAARILEQDVSEGDEIILTFMEHHANIIPWQQLAKRKNLVLKYLELYPEAFRFKALTAIFIINKNELPLNDPLIQNILLFDKKVLENDNGLFSKHDLIFLENSFDKKLKQQIMQ